MNPTPDGRNNHHWIFYGLLLPGNGNIKQGKCINLPHTNILKIKENQRDHTP